MKHKKVVRKTVAKHRKAKPVPVELVDHDQPSNNSVMRIIGHPVQVIAERLHIYSDGRIEKRRLRYIIGGVMMVTGSSMAVGASLIHVHAIGHIAVDIVAYAIHGCGAVPYITHIVRGWQLEG